eukprot:Hpha_TRINITY_DN15790_c0_g1::TRINITY_DN15790_c0_g1_i1::g.38441::m.38441
MGASLLKASGYTIEEVNAYVQENSTTLGAVTGLLSIGFVTALHRAKAPPHVRLLVFGIPIALVGDMVSDNGVTLIPDPSSFTPDTSRADQLHAERRAKAAETLARAKESSSDK